VPEGARVAVENGADLGHGGEAVVVLGAEGEFAEGGEGETASKCQPLASQAAAHHATGQPWRRSYPRPHRPSTMRSSMGSNAEGRTNAEGIMQVDGHETGLEPELV
jgi:hypothetical protein